MRAITPKEAKESVDHIPEKVIWAFNRCIIKNLKNGEARFTQDEVIETILSVLKVNRAEVFKDGLLNVESIFEKAGWRVHYDKPSMGDDYKAFFVFTEDK